MDGLERGETRGRKTNEESITAVLVKVMRVCSKTVARERREKRVDSRPNNSWKSRINST